MDNNIPQQNKIRRRSVWRAPLALILICAVAVVFLSLFFRVSRIEVVNATEYTDEQIIEASGIEKGMNLFFIDRFSAASMIFAGLPYVETVTIERSMPNKIVIQVVGTAAIAYVDLDSQHWLIDRKGKTLEAVDDTGTADYIHVIGLTPVSPVEGEDMVTAEGDDAARLEYAKALLDALMGQDQLKNVAWINLTDVADPSLYFENRFTVYLGTNEEVPYKIALLLNVVSKLTEDDTGTLRYTGGTSWTFSPD